jgi:hypothetical protein
MLSKAAMRQIICRMLYIVAGCLWVGLTNCGYTLVGMPGNALSKRIPVAVSPVINHTREPGLESQMTAALRQAMTQNLTLSLVPESGAPRRLQSVVRQFRTLAISFDARDNVVQYRIEAATYIRLVEAATSVPVIEQEISAWAEYLVSSTGVVRQNVVAREAAIFRLAQQFAEKCTALLEVTLL